MSLSLIKILMVTSCLMLVACEEKSNKTKEPIVEPIEMATLILLEQANEHISLTEDTMYYVDVSENSSTLTVSFAQGLEGKNLGDPDLYIRFQSKPTKGKDGFFDCVSYSKPGNSELCIIDNPQKGRYYILVDTFGQGDGAGVTDGILWASTKLFSNGKTCDVPINIRAQQMSDEELTMACDIISETKLRFDLVLNEGISPEFQQAVSGDLNEFTHINIFSDLLNHKAWMNYLYDSSNESGIYFETSPTNFDHSSEVLTFNGLGWTGGRSVIRSLAHEYIHALDGRYNKEGVYKKELSWWSEGLAEYIGTFYNAPYQRFEISVLGSYTLAEIFNSHKNNNIPSPYDWGQLAVAFLIEKHPADVTAMLMHMRAGDWDEYNVLLATFVANYETEFVDFYTVDIRAQFESSAIKMAINSYEKVEGRGGFVYSVDVADDETSLTISTSGGSGNTGLMVSKNNVPHWINANQPDCNTWGEGNAGNAESCTFSNVTAGTYYIVIDTASSGSDIVDMYLTACTGASCSIELPEPVAIVKVETPVLPVVTPLPDAGEIGSCLLETAYYDRTDTFVKEGFSVTNPTNVPVNLYWISDFTGKANLNYPYATLVDGESYTAAFWVQGDRLMVTDQYKNCVGVAALNSEDNEFTVTEELVADFVELPAPEISSCDLLVPYTRTTNKAANFSVTNTADTNISLYWVSPETGNINFDNNYATLENGDVYAADFWVEGDRMALVDSQKSCLGVLDLRASNNGFVIDSTLFK